MTETLDGNKKAKRFNTDFLQPITYAPVDLTKVTKQSHSDCFQKERHKAIIAVAFFILALIGISIPLAIHFVNTDNSSIPEKPFSKSLQFSQNVYIFYLDIFYSKTIGCYWLVGIRGSSCPFY